MSFYDVNATDVESGFESDDDISDNGRTVDGDFEEDQEENEDDTKVGGNDPF